MAKRKSSAQVLTEVGIKLYGRRWQRPLAKAVGVSESTVRRWLDDGGPPTQILDGLTAFMHRREGEIMEARRELQTWLASV